MIDMGVTSGGDLVVTGSGDLSMVESTAEHQKELILNNQGEYKENPTVGVGAFNYLDDTDGYSALTRAISQQFTADGMEVVGVTVQPNGMINTDAYYK